MLDQADTLFTGAGIVVSGENIEGKLRLGDVSSLVGLQFSSDMVSPCEVRLKDCAMTSRLCLFTSLLRDSAEQTLHDCLNR